MLKLISYTKKWTLIEMLSEEKSEKRRMGKTEKEKEKKLMYLPFIFYISQINHSTYSL